MVSKRFSWRMEVQDSVENSIENSNLPDGHGGSKLSDQLQVEINWRMNTY